MDAEDGVKRPWFRIYEPFITAQQQRESGSGNGSAPAADLVLPPFQ